MSVPVYYRPFELFVGTISEFYCEFHNRICIIWKPRHCLLHERERERESKVFEKAQSDSLSFKPTIDMENGHNKSTRNLKTQTQIHTQRRAYI